MRSDLRNILHPSDSPSSSLTTSNSTSTNPSAPPPSNSVSTSSSTYSRHFPGPHASNSPNFDFAPVSASASTNAYSVATHSSATSHSTFAFTHHSNDARSRPEPPRLNHRRPSPTEHCIPTSSNSRSAFNHSSSLSSILQDPADLTNFASRNSFQSPAHSSLSSTRCPSTSRDSLGNAANLHPNSDLSTTCSTTNGKSSVQPTSTPTTPPSPSPSPIQQSGIAKSPTPNYQSTATQTSFNFSMQSSPQPHPQDRPTSSQAGTHFAAESTHIYPSPHAEPSSGQQSPSHPSTRSNTMQPVDRSSSLGIESVEVVTRGAHIPMIQSHDGKITDTANPADPDVPSPSSDHPCEMCIAQFQAHKDQLHRPREVPLNMAESQRKMGEFSEFVRTMKVGCEKHRHQRTGSAIRDTADEGSQARKRKEPTEGPPGIERHVKAARFTSGSPPSETPSFRGTSGSSAPTSFDSGLILRRSNNPSIPDHLVGKDVATILDIPIPGTAQRPYEPPRKDWQNMWHDIEYERKKEKKNRKDSVPVLPPAADGVEVAPQ